MQVRSFTLVFRVTLVFGLAGQAIAQDNEGQRPSTQDQLQQIHTPQSIDQELTRLTNDLELTPEQLQMVRPMLQQHYDKIQALLDQNPNTSRKDLGPQIHAISDETHLQIHAQLTDHQKKLEKATQQRERNGEENRRPAPPASPYPEPSSSDS